MRLRVLHPCPESFENMSGEGGTRHCDRCDLDVHDLSQRTEEDARTFLSKSAGSRVCIRIARNTAGAIVFAASMSCSSAVTTQAVPQTPDMEYEMGDIVPDIVDKCPDQPGPNDDGCPEVAPDAGPAKHHP